MWSKLELGYYHNPTWLSYTWEAPIIYSYLMQEIMLFGKRIDSDDKTSEKVLSLSHWTPAVVSHVLRLPDIDGVSAAMQALEKSGKVVIKGGVSIPGLAQYQADPTAYIRKERHLASKNASTPFQNGPEPSGTAGNARVDQSREEKIREEKKEGNKKDPPTPRKRRVLTYTTEFESFWAAYPRAIGKGKAAESWEAVTSIRPPLPDILAAIDAQKAGHEWLKDGGQFIPLPATWLNQRRWEDKPRPPIPFESLRQKAERAEREESERLITRAREFDQIDRERRKPKQENIDGTEIDDH